MMARDGQGPALAGMICLEPSGNIDIPRSAMSGLAPLPPCLVLTAGCDPRHEDGHAFAGQLRAAGVDVTLTCLKRSVEGLPAVLSLMPRTGGKVLSHTKQFLHRLL